MTTSPVCGALMNLSPPSEIPDVVDVAARVAEEDEVARDEVVAVHRPGRSRRVSAALRCAGSGCRPSRRPTARAPSSRSPSAVSTRPTGTASRGTSWPSRPPRARAGPRTARRPRRGRRARRRRRSPPPPSAAAPRLPEQAAGLLQAELVAPAVLRGRALDVGDPLAVAARVVDRLAGRDPLLLTASA